MPLVGKDGNDGQHKMTDMVAGHKGASERRVASSNISLSGDLRAKAAQDIVKDHAQPLAKRAAPQSEKSLSASKRDAIWLSAIAKDRDAQALTALFDVYTPKLKGWLMARGAGDATAEDVVQDVMLKVWTGAHMFDPAKASFATWVYRMTRNRWIDHQRKHSRMDVRDPDLMRVIADDEVPSAENGYIEQQESHWLNEEIDKLTPSQQVAIRMAYMEFKTHKEISEETGLPLGTVKTRIRSAMQALKANMADRDKS